MAHQPDITIFVERGRILGKLANTLTAPLVLYSILSLINLYLKTHGGENNPWALYITNGLAVLSTFLRFITISYALGVVTYMIFIARKRFNVGTADILFLFMLALPPITFLFIKSA